MVNIKIKNVIENVIETPPNIYGGLTIDQDEIGSMLNARKMERDTLKEENDSENLTPEKIVTSKPEIVIELPEKIESPAALQNFCDEVYKNLYIFLQNYYKY